MWSSHRASIWTKSPPRWSLLTRPNIKEVAHIVLNAHATLILLLAHRARTLLVMKSNARKLPENMSRNFHLTHTFTNTWWNAKLRAHRVQHIIRSASFGMNLFLFTVFIRWPAQCALTVDTKTLSFHIRLPRRLPFGRMTGCIIFRSHTYIEQINSMRLMMNERNVWNFCACCWSTLSGLDFWSWENFEYFFFLFCRTFRLSERDR